MKNRANILNKYLTDEMRVRPYFNTNEQWRDVKTVLSDFRCLSVDVILSEQQLKEIEYFICIGLDYIAKSYDHETTYELHKYIYDLIDHYLELSIEKELFETSHNIKHVKDSFLVTLIKNQ